MAIESLTEEQVRTWTRAQKDRWWLDHVFRGDAFPALDGLCAHACGRQFRHRFGFRRLVTARQQDCGGKKCGSQFYHV